MPDNTITRIQAITRDNLSNGNALLRRLDSHSNDSRLPNDISSWITENTSQILQLMPPEIPDYEKISALNDKYTNTTNILTLSVKQDIEKVLEHIKIMHDCTVLVCKANYKDIPPKNLAVIGYQGLQNTLDCFETSGFFRTLNKQANGITPKTAIINIYGRILLWLRSMYKLNKTEDCLSLAGCVRSILELYVDLNILITDKIEDAAKKYFSFPRIEKLRVAKVILSRHKEMELPCPPASKELVAKEEPNKEELEALIGGLWGKDSNDNLYKPRHWTNLDLWSRVALLESKDIARIFLGSYSYCNWHIHSMYSDYINDIDNAHLINWHLYEQGQKLFISATNKVNEIAGVMPKSDLDNLFYETQEMSFKLFFGEMVKAGRVGGGKTTAGEQRDE